MRDTRLNWVKKQNWVKTASRRAQNIHRVYFNTWYRTCNASNHKTLQWIVKTNEEFIRGSLPSITDLYLTRCIIKANSIPVDNPHPTHTKSSSCCPFSAKAFSPTAIRLLNTKGPDWQHALAHIYIHIPLTNKFWNYKNPQNYMSGSKGLSN